jgi:diguanylate cyclase (GGDEF)-like protein
MVWTFGYTLADIPTVAQWAHQACPDETYRREVFGIWDAAVARAVSETGQVESMELRVTSKDGRVRDTLFNAIVLGDRLLVGLIDITERRQAERDLRSTREALERTAYEVTEAIPVGTYSMVLEPGAEMAQFSFMSRHFLELTGLEREEAHCDTMKAFACVHPDDFDDWVRLNANDTHGHLVGDAVLVELSQRVRAQLRAVDALARWGGEEFAVLLPHCRIAQATQAAEKRRRLIATQSFPRVGQVTSSFGVAEFLPQDTLDAVLKRADDALYAAKAAGRNRVCVATDQE